MISIAFNLTDFVTIVEGIDRDNTVGWVTEGNVVVVGFASVSTNN